MNIRLTSSKIWLNQINKNKKKNNYNKNLILIRVQLMMLKFKLTNIWLIRNSYNQNLTLIRQLLMTIKPNFPSTLLQKRIFNQNWIIIKMIQKIIKLNWNKRKRSFLPTKINSATFMILTTKRQNKLSPMLIIWEKLNRKLLILMKKLKR